MYDVLHAHGFSTNALPFLLDPIQLRALIWFRSWWACLQYAACVVMPGILVIGSLEPCVALLGTCKCLFIFISLLGLLVNTFAIEQAVYFILNHKIFLYSLSGFLFIFSSCLSFRYGYGSSCATCSVYACTPVVKAALGFSGLAWSVGLTTAGSAVFIFCLRGALYWIPLAFVIALIFSDWFHIFRYISCLLPRLRNLVYRLHATVVPHCWGQQQQEAIQYVPPVHVLYCFLIRDLSTSMLPSMKYGAQQKKQTYIYTLSSDMNACMYACMHA